MQVRHVLRHVDSQPIACGGLPLGPGGIPLQDSGTASPAQGVSQPSWARNKVQRSDFCLIANRGGSFALSKYTEVSAF